MRPSALAVARRLVDVHAAVAIVDQLQAHALQHRRILLQRRQILAVDDRWRHVPGRVDGHILHRLGEQRGRLVDFADHDARGPDLGTVVHHLEREVRQIDHDMGVAEIARVPAPALHVGHDHVDRLVARRAVELLDRLRIDIAGDRQLVGALEFLHRFRELGVVFEVGGIAGEAELLAQQRDARIFHRRLGIELEQRAVGDHLARVALAAHLRELSLEPLIGFVRRAELLERLAGVGAHPRSWPEHPPVRAALAAARY